MRPDDERSEEEAAAAEAAAIGGPAPDADVDPARRPVEEAGGGEAEGFEQAEDALRRNASHEDSGASPTQDAFTGEVESDRSGAEYGEADHVESTETGDEAEQT